MYIWVGCKLPEGFEKAIREKALSENKAIGLDTLAFCLPQHISLKISFSTDRTEAVLAWLREYLARQPSFFVSLQGIEQAPGVLWLRVVDDPVLDGLHRQLDALLLERFAIPRQALDKHFIFHSSLFMDADAEKLRQMAKALAGMVLPKLLPVEAFLLGTSPDGSPGSYRVVAEIPAKKL